MNCVVNILRLFLISGWVTNGHSQRPENKPIEDYAKLVLNPKELLGSRWAIEQNSTITVYHAFDFVDMVKVDLDNMNIRIDYHARQRWTAASLTLPDGLFKKEDKEGVYIVTEEQVLTSVWSPDSFIPNARETKIHSVAAPQSVVQIYPNKTIIWRARMHTLLGCSFSFHWYPLDVQVCDLVFESYKYASGVVNYTWEEYNQVTTDSSILLYQYDLKFPPKVSTGTNKRWGGQANYPYVKVTFKFERKLGNNVIQVFIPTILVVILSWFSFWLGLDAIPGRVSLLITCILTIVTMHSGLKGAIPPVHYIKMMDVWMVACMAFVFAAICEFIIVKYLKWRAMQQEKENEEKEKYLKSLREKMYPNSSTPNALMPSGSDGYPPAYHQVINKAKGGKVSPTISTSAQQRQAWAQAYALGASPPPPDFLLQRHHGMQPPGQFGLPPYGMLQNPFGPPPPKFGTRPIWVQIDRICRIMFPILFAIFNATYWPILLIGARNQHTDA